MVAGRFLMDTHCLLWFQNNNPNIPADVMDILQDTRNAIFFSQISLYEIAIKQKTGKLSQFLISIEELHEQALQDGFQFLPIQNAHLFNYNKIPLNEAHRDPFDRLLLATAYTEDIPILTADEKFHLYDDLIKVIW